MSGVGGADDLERRVWACLIMSALHVVLMLLPPMQRAVYLPLVTTVLVLSVAVGWWALRNVPPSRDADAHVRLAALSSRALIAIAFSATALALILGLTDRMHRQVLPFFVCVFVFLSVAYRVLHVSVIKRMDELLKEP